MDNLYPGTNQDNRNDSYKNDTAMFGERHYATSLTNEKVKEIYRRVHEGERVRLLAEEFGVKGYVIYNIKYGNAWSRITQVKTKD